MISTSPATSARQRAQAPSSFTTFELATVASGAVGGSAGYDTGRDENVRA
jgi:hypothetical protein